MSEITEKLKRCRSKAYYATLKDILLRSPTGQEIIDDARKLERITPVDIGILCLKHDLNFRATCEWLEENHVLRTGIYDSIMRSGLKVRDILEAARQSMAKL